MKNAATRPFDSLAWHLQTMVYIGIGQQILGPKNGLFLTNLIATNTIAAQGIFNLIQYNFKQINNKNKQILYNWFATTIYITKQYNITIYCIKLIVNCCYFMKI